MALISIPTSIGGVSIPGSLVNGPLGALFGAVFGRNDLQYPRDLQSSTRGHVIQFHINEVIPATYKEDTVTDIVKNATSLGNTFSSTENLKDAVFGGAKSLWDGSATQKLVELSNPTTKSVGTISLYIPETVNFTYNAQYDKMSLATAAQELIGAPAKAVAQTLNSGPAKLIGRGLGYAFNPQQQLLFEGIDFRTYQMAFTFTPYSRDEAESVAKIIKMFKTHAAPRVAKGGAGMFFVPPSQFEVKFLFNGMENKKINRIAKSVIESIDVNYAPNGFSTLSDGAPVQTTLTINFKEIELITREKIENGY